MANSLFELKATKREKFGTPSNQRLRREGFAPAVLYGAGKESIALQIEHDKILRALERKGTFSKILSLNIDGKQEQVILKEMQRHPYKKLVTHLDFQRITRDKAITMTVPINFSGAESAPGVKEGGAIFYHLREVEVRCLPADLPESINVDISALGFNQNIHLFDLVLPQNVALTADPEDDDENIPVVSIQELRKEEPAAAAVEAEAAAAAEGEEKKEGEKAEGKKTEESGSKSKEK